MDLDQELNNLQSEGENGTKRLQNDQQLYVVAIISLLLWIPIGTFMAIFSLIRANEELDDYRANPSIYSQESLQKVKNGRTIALVSLGIQILSIPTFIIYVAIMS